MVSYRLSGIRRRGQVKMIHAEPSDEYPEVVLFATSEDVASVGNRGGWVHHQHPTVVVQKLLSEVKNWN